jgi:ribonuclease Z
MSGRELIVLGTASQAPTRHRNHNGYLLRWDDEGVLFDPGEGTQRQFALAGVHPPAVTRICITHFHGDHCLGLPGMLLRLTLDGVTRPVDIHYPASGEPYLQRLRHASISHDDVDLRLHPVDEAGAVPGGGAFSLRCAWLRHGVDALGWRIEEPPGRRMLPERLDALGVHGPDIGRLRRDGSIDAGGRTVHLEDVSAHRPGQSFAFIMDTAWCDAAVELASGADLVVCESTFLSGEEDLARAYGHLTARQAGQLAADAGARRLVLTHFSQRHPDGLAFGEDAAAVFSDVVVAEDLLRVPVPPRRE